VVADVKLICFLVDIDIRKPDTGAVHIDRPSAQGWHTATHSRQTSQSVSPIEVEQPPYTEPLSEGEEDEEEDVAIAADENRRVGFNKGEATEAIAFRNKRLADADAEIRADETTQNGKTRQTSDRGEARAQARDRPTGKPRALSINPLTPAAAFDEVLRNKLKSESAKQQRQQRQQNQQQQQQQQQRIVEVDIDGAVLEEEERILTREWRAEPGKKIAVPVRVEPKVYFACERTFLARLRYLFAASLSLTGESL
jgi:hypothetical protein